MSNNSIRYTALLFLVLAAMNLSAARIRVACVGNSITEGIGASSSAANYPSLLQAGLGTANYEVRNFGISGTTMSLSTDKPYMTHSRGSYKEALEYQPDIVIIKLGTNDAAFHNWPDKSPRTLEEDYKTMVRAFQALDSHPTVYMCLPSYLPEGNTHGYDTSLTQGVIPIIRKVADELGTEIIDCHTPFVGRDWLFGDLLHPNDTGYKLLSYVIGSHIKANYPKPANGTFWTIGKQSRLSYLQEVEPLRPKIIDCSTATYEVLPAGTTDTLIYHLRESVIPTAYSITCGKDPQKAPRRWTLYGSITGTSWSKLHEVKEADFNPYETRTFTLPSSNTGRNYLRLIISAPEDNDAQIYEFQAFGAQRTLPASLLKSGGGKWSAEYQTIPNEDVTKLSDGRTGIFKYCTQVSGTTAWVRYDAPEEWTVTGYSLITGDYYRRDRWATSWKLEGSNNDGASWYVIDSRTNQFFGGPSSQLEFSIAAPGSYKSYRLTLRSLKENQYVELSELQLYGAATSPVETVKSPSTLPTMPWTRLNGTTTSQPTLPGIYVHQGKKVLVK